MTKLTFALATLALTVALAPATALASDRSAARAGAGWLSSAVKPGADGMAADAIVALRAAGRLPAGEAARRARALRAGANAYAHRWSDRQDDPRAHRCPQRQRPLRWEGRPLPAPAVLRARRPLRHHDLRPTLAMLAAHALHAGPSQKAVNVLLNAPAPEGWNFNLTRSGGRADDVTQYRDGDPCRPRRGACRPATALLRAGLRAGCALQRTPAGGFALGRPRDRKRPTRPPWRSRRPRQWSRDTRATRALASLQPPAAPSSSRATTPAAAC